MPSLLNQFTSKVGGLFQRVQNFGDFVVRETTERIDSAGNAIQSFTEEISDKTSTPPSFFEPPKQTAKGFSGLFEGLPTPVEIFRQANARVGEIGEVGEKLPNLALIGILKGAATLLRVATEEREEGFMGFSEDTIKKKFGQEYYENRYLKDPFVVQRKKLDARFNELVSAPLNRYSVKILNALDFSRQTLIRPLLDEKPGLSNFKEYVLAIGEGAVSLGEAVGITLATKNTGVAAAFLSTLESSDEYNNARDSGLSPDAALQTATRSGLGTFVLEKIGLDYLFGVHGGSTIFNALKVSGFETVQEEFQTVWQNVNRKYSVNEGQKIFEGWWDTAVAISLPSFVAGLLIPKLSLKTSQDLTMDIRERAGLSQKEAANAVDEMISIARGSLTDFGTLRGLTIEDVSGLTPDLIRTRVTESITGMKEIWEEAGVDLDGTQDIPSEIMDIIFRDIGNKFKTMHGVVGLEGKLKQELQDNTYQTLDQLERDVLRVLEAKSIPVRASVNITRKREEQEAIARIEEAKTTEREVEEFSIQLQEATTGVPIVITGFAGMTKSGQDSGFRSPDRRIAQDYALTRGGEIRQFTEELFNPFVTEHQTAYLRTLDDAEARRLIQEFDRIAKEARGTTNTDSIVREMDAFIKDRLLREGFDGVIYTDPNVNEYQVFDPEAAKTDAMGEVELRRIFQEEFEDVQKQGKKDLFDAILKEGGLKTPQGLKEEMSPVPLRLRNNNGQTPDEMAQSLNAQGYNFEDGEDLRMQILDLEETTPKVTRAVTPKADRVQLFDIEDAEARRTRLRMRRVLGRIRDKAPKVLSDRARQILENRLFKEAMIGGRGGGVRGTIRRTVEGEPSREITKREDVLLRERLRAERKGARGGVREGIKVARQEIMESLREEHGEIISIKKQISDYVKDNLDPKDRGKANVILRDAQTYRNLISAFSRIDRWAEDARKNTLRDEIIKIQQRALDSPNVAVDVKERIKDALNEFELHGHRPETLQKIAYTKKFLERKFAEGEEVEMPQRVLDALGILSRQPFEEISLRTLEGVKENIAHLEHLGKTKWNSIQELYEMEKETIKAELVAGTTPLQKIQKIKPEIGESLTISQKAKNFAIGAINAFNKTDKVLSPTDVLMDILDGARGTYDGVNMRLIKNRIDYAFNAYLDLRDEIRMPVVRIAQELDIDEGSRQRVGIVAVREQEFGMEKLKASGYSEKEVNEIKLTENEQKFLNTIRAVLDEQFPFIQDVMRNVYNQPVRQVKNYFSFMTDWKAMDDTEVFLRLGPSAEEFGHPTKNVEMGFTKTRVGGEQQVNVDALEVFLKHTDNVAYLRAVGKDAKMLFEIANSKEYAEAAGDLGQLLVLEWVDLVTRKGGQAGAGQIAAVDFLRKNFSAGVLGLKLSSAAIQWTAILDGAGMIGPVWAGKGSTDMATSKQWREFVMKFPEMKERAGGELAIRELVNGGWFARVQEKGFAPLVMIDKLTAASVAAGAYQKKMQELGRQIDLETVPDKEAMEYAQLVVRRTQSTASFKDLPLALSRGVGVSGNRSINRALFQFQTFLLTRWSRVRHDAIRVGIKTKDPAHAVNVLSWIAIANLAATGTRMAVSRLMDFITGDDGDDEEKTIAEEAGKSMLSEFVGMIPIVSNIWGAFVYDSNLVPIMEPPRDAILGAKKAIEAKTPQTRAKGINEFITSITAGLGVPGSFQAQQIGRKIIEKAIPKEEAQGIFPALPEFPPLPKLPELPTFP